MKLNWVRKNLYNMIIAKIQKLGLNSLSQC